MPDLTPPDEVPVLKRHHFEQWADGQWRTFWNDRDLKGQDGRSFYQSARKFANRRGLNFSGRVLPDRVLIQMWPKEAPDDGGDATEPAATERADPLG